MPSVEYVGLTWATTTIAVHREAVEPMSKPIRVSVDNPRRLRTNPLLSKIRWVTSQVEQTSSSAPLWSSYILHQYTRSTIGPRGQQRDHICTHIHSEATHHVWRCCEL